MKRHIMIMILCCLLAGCSADSSSRGGDIDSEAADDAIVSTEPVGDYCQFTFTLYHSDDEDDSGDGLHGSWHATVEHSACLGSNNASITGDSSAIVDISILEELCDEDGIVLGDLTQWTWEWHVNPDHNMTWHPHCDYALVNIPNEEISATFTSLDATTLEIVWEDFAWYDLSFSQRLCLDFWGSR